MRAQSRGLLLHRNNIGAPWLGTRLSLGGLGGLAETGGCIGIVACRVVCEALLVAGSLHIAYSPAQVPNEVDGDALRPPLQAVLPAHGGEVRMAGPFWLELVMAKGSLTVYVTDRSGLPVATAGGHGAATAHTDGKATRVELRTTGGNRLAGKGKLRLKHSTVVFITADLRGEKPYRAVFRPPKRATAGVGR